MRCNDLSCCLCIVSRKLQKELGILEETVLTGLNDVGVKAAEISLHNSVQSDSCCLLDAILNLKLGWLGNCNMFLKQA